VSNLRRNIYAFTEPSGSYPGYVSVNVEADGRVSVTVRSSPQKGREGTTASFTLPAEQSDLLTDAMIDHSYSDEEPCP
jgi:hypothetical protein